MYIYYLGDQDKLDTQDKLESLEKELKDALSQKTLAMSEYNEVTDKYVVIFISYHSI